MTKLHPVAGTKERARYREGLTYTLKASGQVIVDGVRPRDHMEMTARLWGHYGKGSIKMTARRMERGEKFTELDDEEAA